MNKAVELARQCIGMNEKDGSFKVIIDTYNTLNPLPRGYKMKYTDAWCATFISYLGIKLGYTDIIPPECGCERQIDLFKKISSWDENDARVPNPGDIIYYDWQDSGKGDNQGWSDHVGIVESCDGKTITVIEGNKNEAVGRRNIAVNARYIRGYGVPEYPAEPAKPEEPKADENQIREFVTRFYTYALQRKPDQAGLDAWTSALASGSATGKDIAYGFFFSPEFLNKNLSNAEYLKRLYKTLFNRDPDTAGFNAWLDQLNNGVSRQEVLNGFLNSVEFKRVCDKYNIKC